MTPSPLQALIEKHRNWKSECWNPINPHALTCQTSPIKPCDSCAAIIQAHLDFADELAEVAARMEPAKLCDAHDNDTCKRQDCNYPVCTVVAPGDATPAPDLRAWVQHKSGCPVSVWKDKPVPDMKLTPHEGWHKVGEHQAECTCGLQAALDRQRSGA